MAKCIRTGCLSQAISRGFCGIHSSSFTKKETKEDSLYDSYQYLYKTSSWKSMRMKQLSMNPLCQKCKSFGFVKSGTDVDHVIPHKGIRSKFYDLNNLQTLCRPCHSWKTNEERKERFHDFRNF